MKKQDKPKEVGQSKIKFQNTEVLFEKIKQKTNYFEMSAVCLDGVVIKPEGITTGGIRAIFKLIDKLEEAKDKKYIELEKAEIQMILKSEAVMPWTLVDRQIIKFEDYLQKLAK